MPEESKRRSERVAATIPIQLVGADTAGQQFLEDTATVMLSRYGAAIFSKHKLSPEQEMILRRRDTNREEEVRIVAKIKEQGEGFLYAMGFVRATADLWGNDFGTAMSSARGESEVVFVCSSCEHAEKVAPGEVAYGVLEEDSGVLRYCMGCRTMTSWKAKSGGVVEPRAATKPANKEAGGPSVVDAPRVMPERQPGAPPTRERRKYSRAKAGVIARIQFAGFAEDVSCENISRGGICFKTTKRYFENVHVEVAVPYSAGTQCIFVPAKIIYVQELPERAQWRCGLAYDAGAKKGPAS